MVGCILMALSLASAQKPAEQKKSKSKIRVLRIYDPQKDETSTGTMLDLTDLTRAIGFVDLSGSTPGTYDVGSQMSASYTFPGKIFSRPESVRVVFAAFSKGKYKTKNDYMVKADGELLFQGKAEYQQQQLTTLNKDRDKTYEERLTLVIPLDLFIRLANAKKVQLKIGPTDFDLSGEQRERLKALAASIDKCESPDCVWGTLKR